MHFQGREIFVEQLPQYALQHDPAVLPCPPYCAAGSPNGSVEIGGGAPSAVIERVVASGHVSGSWLVDSNAGAVRLQSVRLEGIAGVMRNTGVPGAWPTKCANASATNCGPIADGRFTDMLIDVSNSYGPTNKPLDDTAISCAIPCVVFSCCMLVIQRIQHIIVCTLYYAYRFARYVKPGELHLLGGSFGGNVVLGNGTNLYSMGVRCEFLTSTTTGALYSSFPFAAT